MPIRQPSARGVGERATRRSAHHPRSGRARARRVTHRGARLGAFTPCRGIRPAAFAAVVLWGVGLTLLSGPRVSALSLEAALAAARREAPSIVQRRYDAAYAETVIRQARSAWFPQVSSQVTGTYNAFPPKPVTIESGSFGSLPNPLDPTNPTPLPEEDVAVTEETKNTFYSLRVTVDQPLYASGRIRAETESANLLRTATRADLDAEIRLVERQVREAFATVVFAESSLDLVGEMESLARANLFDRRKAFDEGTVNREAVLQAELDLVQFESQAVEYAEVAKTARSSLALLTGRPVDGRIEYAFPTSAPDLDETALLDAAIAASAERAAAQARAEQARASVRAVSRPLRPSVGVQVAGEVSGPATPFSEEGWVDTWDPTFRVSVSVELLVSDGGRGRGESEARHVRVEQAHAGVAAIDDRVSLAVRRAVESVHRAEAAVQRARAAVALSSERRRNAEISFENGLIRPSAVRAAATGELAQRLEHLAARFDLEMGLIAVRHLVDATLE